jgi:heme A synthase
LQTPHPTLSGLSGARDTPRYWLNRVASIAAVVVLVIVVSSAYLRQVSVRLNCPAWPDCVQRVTSEDPSRVQAIGERLARLVHRLSASIAAAMVLLIAYLSWAQQPRVRPDIALSAALVVLTVFLAVLGRWSKSSQVPLITLGNLLGGMTLMTLLYWMGLRTAASAGPAMRGGPLALVAGAALALAFADVALGALIGSTRANLVPGHEWLHTAHWLSGLVVVVLTAALTLHRATRERFPSAEAAACGLAIALALSGWIATRLDYPLFAALTHNLLAALLLIALTTAAYRHIGSGRHGTTLSAIDRKCGACAKRGRSR